MRVDHPDRKADCTVRRHRLVRMGGRTHRLRLVREWLAGGLKIPGRRLPGAGLVRVRGLMFAEVFDDRAVALALRPVDAGARIEADAGQGDQAVRRRAGDDERTAVVGQADQGDGHMG